MLINDASITGSLIVNASASLQNISLGGNIIPDETNLRNLGSTEKFFKEIYVSTGSINFVDDGNIVAILNKETLDALQNNTESANSRLAAIEIITSSITARLSALETSSASVDTLNTTQSNRLGSLETISASNISRITALETTSASVDTLNTTQNNRLSALETTSASVDTLNTTQNTRLTNLEIKTGSLATTGSNSFIGTQTITGSLFISANLVVQGTSSLENITASAVSIGTNIVNLNTANPAIRYAGLVIGDSGSIGSSGSFLYDSVQDEMIFVHRGANATVTSSVVLMGPQTFDNIGGETYPTSNIIQKGTGNEHLVDSCIFDNGTTTCIKNNLVVGVGNFSNCLTFGDWTTATNILTSNKPNEQGAYIRAAVSTAEYPTYTFEDDRDTGMYRAGTNSLGFATNGSSKMVITNDGRVGIGSNPDYGTLSILCRDNTIIGSTEWGTSAASNLVMAVYNESQCVGSAAGIRFITRGSGASIWNIYNISTGASTGDLAFGNGTGGSGTEKMRITNTGLVGIGTIEPQSRLHLCTINTSAIVRVESACDQAGIRLIAGVPGTGRATRIDFLNGATCIGRPQWSIINDYSQNGTNELNFVNCDPATRVLQIFQSGVACFSNTISAPYYAGGTSYTIDFLVVAGGGGGGGSEMSNGFGGGGGAGGGGGYLASSISLNCGSSYPIVVGTGGAGGASRLAQDGSGLPGSPGTFSSAFGFIAIGGGAGAGDEGTAENTAACQSGGSGGGRGGDSGGRAGIAVIGQGNNGGPNVSRSGGGGGGAAQTTGGNTGGAGRQWLDGNFYAGGGGGGGGGNDQTQWLGGVGGGGNGSRSFPGGGTSGEAGGQATAGQACTGGGGGGAGSGYLQGGMAGGSGIVIIRYFGSQRGSGGTVSSLGGYTYHRFGANGTYTA
jgi:hypothetical protein